MKSRFLALILAIFLLAGCASFSDKPAIVYETQPVNTAVAVFADAPVVDKFESHVLQLTDSSKDGEVGQAYKSDWLSLMYRDRIFTDFLQQYRKAKQDAKAATK